MENTHFGLTRETRHYDDSSDDNSDNEPDEFLVPKHRPRIRYVIYCHGAQKHDNLKCLLIMVNK